MERGTTWLWSMLLNGKPVSLDIYGKELLYYPNVETL